MFITSGFLIAIGIFLMLGSFLVSAGAGASGGPDAAWEILAGIFAGSLGWLAIMCGVIVGVGAEIVRAINRGR